MTSREILKHIKKAPSFIGGDSRYLGVSNSSDLFLKDCEQIEKDLKILEIIKKYFNIELKDHKQITNKFIWISNNRFTGMITQEEINDEEFEFLKEYLKNEKLR